MDKLVTDIKDLIQGFKSNMERHLPMLEAEVNRLIAEKSQDKRAIEHLLDTMLSLTMWGLVKSSISDWWTTTKPSIPKVLHSIGANSIHKIKRKIDGHYIPPKPFLTTPPFSQP